MENNLSTAFQYHQQGFLDQAAQIYQLILASNPEHTEALHLLGLVALQQANPARAVELIGRAIALHPRAAVLHSNLAEAYRLLSQLEKAADCCRTALRLQPHFPAANNNLGLSLQALGQTAAAIDQFREALRRQPGFAMAHNNLGIALGQSDKAQAMDHFRQALRFAPTLAEAHSNLGQMLSEQGKPEEALVHCQEAVRLRPTFSEAQVLLGIVLRTLERLPEAKACYAEALRLDPNSAAACNNMGQLVQEEGKLDESLTWYQRSLRLEPNPLVHCNLAGVWKEKENQNEAFAQYEQALRLDPNSAAALNGLGWVRHEQGRCEEALDYYRRALQILPDFALARCNLGTLHEEMGDFEAAQRCFREALRHGSDHAEIYGQLATLLGGKLPEPDLATIRRLVAEPTLSDEKRLALHFGMAHVLDAQGDYDRAAEHVRQANALCLAGWHKRGQSYNLAAHEGTVDRTIATRTPAFFERVHDFGSESDRPIFIVGLPRSGTTLTEQVLASHSQVFGAGELPLARDLVEALPRVLNIDAPAVECLTRLDRESAHRISEHYLDQLNALNREARHVVDKMPENYLCLGMLAALFPRARFIHCRRDLRDVAVSCWMTHFRHVRWASDPEHIASRLHAYLKLMEHWRQVLPVECLEVQYEEMVADLETVARRLVAWCGLEWEPACLDFYKGRRPVRSASVIQVRQPIYSRAVGRWKNYERVLAPLLAQFTPVAAG